MYYALPMAVTMSIFVALLAYPTNAQEHPEAAHPPAAEVGVAKRSAFPVVTFVRDVEMSFPQSSDRVCPMFDPRTRQTHPARTLR